MFVCQLLLSIEIPFEMTGLYRKKNERNGFINWPIHGILETQFWLLSIVFFTPYHIIQFYDLINMNKAVVWAHKLQCTYIDTGRYCIRV